MLSRNSSSLRRLVPALASAALALFALAACSDPAPIQATPSAQAEPPAPTPVFAVVYRCTDGTVFTAFPRGESAQVDYANRNPAPGSMSDSAECTGTDARDVWAAAQLRGVTTRAIGTEPGWLLEITPGQQLVLAWDNGMQRTQVATPEAKVDAATKTTVYAAKTPAGNLKVEITEGACSDGMSDTTYTASAAVTLNKQSFKGCARTL